MIAKYIYKKKELYLIFQSYIGRSSIFILIISFIMEKLSS